MGLFNRPPRTQHELLDSAIGPTANFSGTLRSDGGLRIEGHFEGLIEVAGNVVVADGARVMADITARNITVGGQVQGNINGTGRLEILATGQVVGDITVASVVIDDGGLFQGISRMRGYEQRALPAAPEPPANGAGRVYVEEPRPEKLATVDLTARTAAEPVVIEQPPASPKNSTGGTGSASTTNPAGSSNSPGKSSGSGNGGSAGNPGTASSAAKAPAPVLKDEIDFDDIEPVIPDIVIEEPAPAKTPDSPRRNRR